MEKTTTLYRLCDGEPVELESDHAKRVLDYEKRLGLAAHSKKPPTPPDNETNRPAGDTDGNQTSPGPSGSA